MKLLKNSFLGTVFLLAVGSASIAGTFTSNDGSEATMLFNCYDTHTRCNDLYPSDYNGFDRCMSRGGCDTEAQIQ